MCGTKYENDSVRGKSKESAHNILLPEFALKNYAAGFGWNLLMTDVVMPEMNGRDLARNILSLYPAPGIADISPMQRKNLAG
jgi:CheY-like chemotaxis protein